MIKKLLMWVFKDEFYKIKQELTNINMKLRRHETTVGHILEGVDLSVDVHEYNRHSSSWAVISIQGQKTNYIKFIDLRDSDVYEISRFIERYDRINHIKVDASPMASEFLRVANKPSSRLK